MYGSIKPAIYNGQYVKLLIGFMHKTNGRCPVLGSVIRLS